MYWWQQRLAAVRRVLSAFQLFRLCGRRWRTWKPGKGVKSLHRYVSVKYKKWWILVGNLNLNDFGEIRNISNQLICLLIPCCLFCSWIAVWLGSGVVIYSVSVNLSLSTLGYGCGYHLSCDSSFGVLNVQYAGQPRNHGLIPDGGKRFISTDSLHLWGPPSLLFTGYHTLFPGDTVAGAWTYTSCTGTLMVKFTVEQATKTQMGSRGIALLFL